MKIAIMTTMPPNTYSGGRYSAWIMAECLVHKQNTVYFITNNMPIFYNDFKSYEEHNNIKIILTSDYEVKIEEKEIDYVILVPNQDKQDYFYVMCRNFARIKNAKLVLLNFESPNWFNKYSPMPRDEKMWTFWKDTCTDGCLVLSISEEGMKYARQFYTDNPDYTRFEYWYPAMNSKVADSIKVEKEKRIISFVRFQDKHKGGGDIFDLFGDYLKGYTLVFVVGNGKVDRLYENKLDFLSEKYGFKYEIKLRLSDEEKFREIKRARIMLFPSYFEGYGYPPVEAQYCNTQCVAYDLPVLRETSGDGIIYCERGNMYAMKDTLKEVVENYEYRELKANILQCGEFEIRANDIHEILKKYLQDDYRNYSRPRYLKIVKPDCLKDKEAAGPKKEKDVKRANKFRKEENVRKETTAKKNVRNRLGEWVSRIYRMRIRMATKCGNSWNKIKKQIKRIKNGIFLRRIQIHLGTKEYNRDTGSLYLKGWYLTWRDIDRIEVLNGKGDILGCARFGLKRPDVYKRFPKYGTMQLGYEFEENVHEKDMDDLLRVRIKCSDGKITWADFPGEENIE